MRPLQNFKNLSTNNLFETEKILKESNLVVHSSITRIVLMGSRGLLGGFRQDSDIDLGFILHPDLEPRESLCRKANELSLSHWTGSVALDTAIVFDKMGCGLPCFEKQEYNPELCNYGKDCIGLFKIQKGFSGFVPDIGLEVKNIYPILIIWEKED
ncbi:MAG: hypothetical protein JXR49_21815 [Acidobacteria bacterium]|nr:hypothetical protein [Acidobacteriota bacterium]